MILPSSNSTKGEKLKKVYVGGGWVVGGMRRLPREFSDLLNLKNFTHLRLSADGSLSHGSESDEIRSQRLRSVDGVTATVGSGKLKCVIRGRSISIIFI